MPELVRLFPTRTLWKPGRYDFHIVKTFAKAPLCFQLLFPYLKIPSYNKFSKCDICFATNMKKRKFKSLQEKRAANTCFQNKSYIKTLITFFRRSGSGEKGTHRDPYHWTKVPVAKESGLFDGTVTESYFGNGRNGPAKDIFTAIAGCTKIAWQMWSNEEPFGWCPSQWQAIFCHTSSRPLASRSKLDVVNFCSSLEKASQTMAPGSLCSAWQLYFGKQERRCVLLHGTAGSSKCFQRGVIFFYFY